MDKIDFKNIKDEVAEVIKREIIAGRITNEHPITQSYLAKQFGLSRMPIREAFNTLIQEGLLIKQNNRKLKVITINEHTISRYNEILSSTEFLLLTNPLLSKAKYQFVLTQSAGKDNDKETLIAVIHSIAHLASDHYIKNLFLNMLNVFWTHSLLYCHPDCRTALKKVEVALTELCQKDVDLTKVKSNLLSANQIILSGILL
ncbi:MAG: hypothetical protein CENE_02342 [Candidatus Celerinatantimonas neptuna]|nr:MAG: hypothetical protein CENE_02342 [Candidatus Celerinatantimonas neptuna]